jgi:hypothetical protein
MRARTLLIVLAAGIVSIGMLAAPAVAGKKKKTTVILNSGSPSIKNSGTVKATGSLKTTDACKLGRGMKLFQTNQAGGVLATLDSATSDGNGNWRLQGKLPSSTPSGSTVYFQAKATKRTVNKAVCKAGLSPIVSLTAP